MIRIAFLCAFALISTNAFACEGAFRKAMAIANIETGRGTADDRAIAKQPVCNNKPIPGWDEAWEKKAAERQAKMDRLEADMRADREYQQRERLAIDEDNRQSLIQGQLNQLNMNTIPLR